MYNETYEEYIRSILGYPNYGSNYQAMPMNENNNSSMQSQEIESCYPEIYKLVYPMVNKACNTNTRPITPELIEELTNEIYSSIENDSEINITINLNNEVSSSNENRGNTNSMVRGNKNTIATVASSSTSTKRGQENRGEDRQFRNRGLQDLIKVLLIRELLGRPGNRPPRPPMPPQGRPPFPPPVGGPIFGL